MLNQYAFFYLMKKDIQNIENIVYRHIHYWEKHQPDDYTGGPFEDRSGGLILFKARDSQAAERLAENDPFVVEKAIKSKWLKRWIPAS